MEIKLKKIVDNLRTATLLPRQCTDRRDVNEKKGQKVKSSKKQKDTEKVESVVSENNYEANVTERAERENGLAKADKTEAEVEVGQAREAIAVAGESADKL